jgi:hypothetical protein
MKRCWDCGEIKPRESFYGNRSRSDGLSNRCKPCHLKYGKTRPRPTPEYNRAYKLRTKYGITQADYDRMLLAQDGGCAVCGSDDPGLDRDAFTVDHDHACCPGQKTCGECVRGLLCYRCNLLLGHAGDDPDLLTSAMAYLLQAKSVLPVLESK